MGNIALAQKLNDEELTLEQKLALIDQAMKEQEAEDRDHAINTGTVYAPRDPSDAFACEGCQ